MERIFIKFTDFVPGKKYTLPTMSRGQSLVEKIFKEVDLEKRELRFVNSASVGYASSEEGIIAILHEEQFYVAAINSGNILVMIEGFDIRWDAEKHLQDKQDEIISLAQRVRKSTAQDIEIKVLCRDEVNAIIADLFWKRTSFTRISSDPFRYEKTDVLQ